MSRLHLVVDVPGESEVEVRDLDGRIHSLSLLAYEGDPPEIGDWLIAQSGFALAPADPRDVAGALELLGAPGEGTR